jgi:hypothetical protein
MPARQRSVNETVASDSRRTDCSTASAITGLNTFSSKWPWLAAMFTVVWLPMTRVATMVSASAWVGLTLPGMIEEPGSFSGRISSPRPERGPEPRKRMSLAILNRSPASAASAPWNCGQRAVARQRLELVLRRAERQAGDARDIVGEQFRETVRRVEAGADGGAALGERVDVAERLFDAGQAQFQRGAVAGKLLAERQRRRVLGVGAADLHDIGELLFLRLGRGEHVVERRDQPFRRLDARRRCASRSGRCRWRTGRH